MLRIFPGGSHVDTFSPSRLTSRSRSRLDRFPLILSNRTASTSITPFEDPNITFSLESEPWGDSMYFEYSARKKDVP